MNGKEIRLNRIRDPESGNFLIVPMDHGVSIGPVDGLRDMSSTISKIAEGGGDAVLMQKGNLRDVPKQEVKKLGFIAHLNASTSLGEPNNKVVVGRAKDALRRGADAISLHINVGSETEPHQLKDLGEISEECEEFGVPLAAMTYVRGPDVDSTDVDNIAHATRMGAELGADLVKTSYTGNPEEYRKVVEGCPVPIVIAGGPKADSHREVLEDIRDAMDIGVRGTMMGRNIFQHEDVPGMVDAISGIVHEDKTVQKAMSDAGI
jgi:fructose-bisphosphate aldolase/2-amino-3,7-dideoxy-D-threo-hept-6-ulosonate synthase